MTGLTVAVPFFGAPALLPKAVGSLLEQTYRDLRVVVVADGEDAPALPNDPRLTVYRLPENRGTYFATAVALAACETEWFSIHAADDWSEPGRFERLMAATGPDVDAVFGGSVQHNGRTTSLRPAKFHRGGHRPRHVGSIATGIFRTSSVQSFRWWSHPEFRVGYDSLMVNLVLRVLRWRHVPGEFGYHRVIRRDSLTRNPATGLNSEYRAAASRRRGELWERLIAAEPAEWPDILRPAPEVAAAVQLHAQALRSQVVAGVAA